MSPPPERVAGGLERVHVRAPAAAATTAALGRADRAASVVARLAGGEPDDRYAPEGEVGRGGMGKVLRVRDRDLNRAVAMKVLLRGDDGAALERFLAEAQITGQLEHPAVLAVHDVGLDADGAAFFTMRLAEGHEPLDRVIERLRAGDPATHREWTFERRVAVVQRVAQALHYAHRRGVLHRDVKPSNVLVGPFGEVFLVDWGVATLMEPVAPAAGGAATRQDAPAPCGAVPATCAVPAGGSAGAGGAAGGGASGDAAVAAPAAPVRAELPADEEGSWAGTLAYMAPEQVLGAQGELGAPTDVYALSALLYELLSLHYYLGELEGKVSDVVAAILRRRPLDAEAYWHRVNGRVPRALSRICRRGLQKRPADRWRSAEELARALQAWLEGRAPVVCPGTAIQRGLAGYLRWIDRRPTLAPAVTIAAAAALLAWTAAATVLALR